MFRSNEQKLFAQIVGKHIAVPDAPLLIEGGTGIGKTRAYLSAVAETEKRVAIILPTHSLIDQLLASSDLAAVGLKVVAFRPASKFETRREYEGQREAARNARVMVCTAASVIIDQRLSGEYNGAIERDVLLFDEADQLPDMAALQSDFEIGAELIDGEPLPVALERVASAGRRIEPEIRAAARIMLEIIAEPVGYARVGIDDDGNAVLYHYVPGRLLKKISNRPCSIFVSATLSHGGHFDHFRNAMGIEKVSELSCMIEPERHGQLTFDVQQHVVDTPEWLAATIEAIRTAPRPCLVVTTSHDLTERLQVASGDGVTIRAAAWAGLDLADRPASIIVPRVPFSSPVVIDGEPVSRYFDAHVTAVRRLRQVIGRGLRTPDAVCRVTILDARATRLGEFVPKRFREAWPTFDEGGRGEVVLSKAERNPALRKSALRRYGAKCQHPDCNVTALHMLDVHHLDPIAEGQRRTTVEDVTVLCANHHREAHHAMRKARLE